MVRIGHGYDVHRLAEGRKLILGGVEIPYEKGLQGHSDADVLVHAIMDSMLGALALGDIGKHFPDPITVINPIAQYGCQCCDRSADLKFFPANGNPVDGVQGIIQEMRIYLSL